MSFDSAISETSSSTSTWDQSSDDDMDSDMSVHSQSDVPMSVQTKTTSRSYYVNWVIDERSLLIARMAARGERRGVVEATVSKEGLEFKLELCVSGWKNSSDGYTAFYLTIPEATERLTARYKIKVGDFDRMSTIRTDFHLGVGFPNFCHKSIIDKTDEHGQLRICVIVEIFTCESKVEDLKQNNRLIVSKPENVLSRTMKQLYESRLHTDLKLVCRNEIIPVHKCLLSCFSPVFRALFSHNFVENQSNELHLNEWHPRTIKEMVKFLYTAQINIDFNIQTKDQIQITNSNSNNNNNININNNQRWTENNSNLHNVGLDFDENKVETTPPPSNNNNNNNNSNTTFELFRLAECYKIESLVIACCEKMYSQLSLNTASNLLIQFDRYSHVNEVRVLQNDIWEFVIENIRKIKILNSYQKLRQYPSLMSTLVDKLSQ
jgi:hypothetical protein